MALTTLRRMAAIGIATLALAGGASEAAATPPLDALAARLSDATVIHADFDQTKTLAALKRPLRTSGSIVFVRGAGVLWRIDKPYQATYALTVDTVTEIGPDGTRKVRAARDVPALANVGRVFEALFAGDLKRLEEHFAVAVSGTAEAWRVELTPTPTLAPFLNRILANGGAFLERIEVHEARGDHTRIDFIRSSLDRSLSDTDALLLRKP